VKRPGAALIACTCGEALRDLLDFERVSRALYPGPALVVNDFCLAQGRAKASAWLGRTAADQVVVAACAAPAAAPALAEVADAAGVELHRATLVDIREGCAWVHPRRPEATSKAVRQIRAAAAGLALGPDPPAPIERTLQGATLVIGGDRAGAAAAARLEALGSQVILLEPPGEADPAPAPPNRDTPGAPQRLRGTLLALEGEAGNFQARIESAAGMVKLAVGAVILSGGPSRDAPRRDDPSLVSLDELLRAQANGSSAAGPQEQAVVFLMEDEPWPALTEAMLGVALRLVRERRCHCSVLFRDLGVAGAGLEELYREARLAGVAFARLGPDTPEMSRAEGGGWTLQVEIAGLGTTTWTADLLVRCALPEPPDLRDLDRALGIGRRRAGAPGGRMFLEPIFSERSGVFRVGAARSPTTLEQAVRQGEAAAMAATLVAAPGAALTPVRAVVDTERCALCLTCLRVCPHGAVRIGEGPAMQVLVSACQGCGVCAAACPAGAIQALDAQGDRLLAEVDALLEPPLPEDGLAVVYACANSALPAAQALGRLRRAYGSRVMLVSVPCLGRIEAIHALRPLVAGASRVLLGGCFDGSCEHVVGPPRARVVAAHASAIAAILGLDPSAIEVAAVAPVDWHRLAGLLEAAGVPGPAGTQPREPAQSARHEPEGGLRAAG
jgi:coenzyme F420-reducing hydrogenase delta subunit/Pyruvate/2-oxoacid:ferredoxin oxidoreductase delta subunit